MNLIGNLVNTIADILQDFRTVMAAVAVLVGLIVIALWVLGREK